MTIRPEEWVYQPPSRGACEENPWHIHLDNEGRHRLEVVQWVYRGLIVDFALMQVVDIEGVDEHIARIDCCHGRVHRHVFDSEGNDLVESQTIEVIPEKDSWKRVDTLYLECYDKMLTEWAENYRRWERA